MTSPIARSSSSSLHDDERCQAASVGADAACCSASRAHDLDLFARLDALEAHPVLRGPLDVIEARERAARLLDAIVACLSAPPRRSSMVLIHGDDRSECSDFVACERVDVEHIWVARHV